MIPLRRKKRPFVLPPLVSVGAMKLYSYCFNRELCGNRRFGLVTTTRTIDGKGTRRVHPRPPLPFFALRVLKFDAWKSKLAPPSPRAASPMGS
jgi:hypothetical protein